MPLHDALLALTDKALETVPGLLRGHIAALRVALRQARLEQSPHSPYQAAGSGTPGPPLGAASSTPMSTPASGAAVVPRSPAGDSDYVEVSA